MTITEVEPHGGHIRLRAGELLADVTLRTMADLGLTPGSAAVFVVKATEVSVYPP